MNVTVATTEEERQTIYALRRQVYAEEMHIDPRVVHDAGDETARHYYLRDGERVVGALRVDVDSDRWPADVRAAFDVARFEAVTPPTTIQLACRFMVLPELRGTLAPLQLLQQAFEDGLSRGVQVGLCDCQPHLVGLYLRLGLRSYAPAFTDPIAGLVVPLVLLRDVPHLRRVNSPLLYLFEKYSVDEEALRALRALLPEVAAVGRVADGDAGARWAADLKAAQAPLKMFDGLGDQEVARLIEHGTVIEGHGRGLVIGRGQVTRTLYVVLAGAVEIRLADRLLGVANAGEVVGEMAYLLDGRRTADVFAASEDVRLLAFSDGTLDRLVEADPAVAARLFRNLARIVSRRVVELHQLMV
jgi:CRP-like cAMP-binding protein